MLFFLQQISHTKQLLLILHISYVVSFFQSNMITLPVTQSLVKGTQESNLVVRKQSYLHQNTSQLNKRTSKVEKTFMKNDRGQLSDRVSLHAQRWGDASTRSTEVNPRIIPGFRNFWATVAGSNQASFEDNAEVDPDLNVTVQLPLGGREAGDLPASLTVQKSAAEGRVVVVACPLSLGCEIQEQAGPEKGINILEVFPDSNGEKAGIKAGDKLLAVSAMVPQMTSPDGASGNVGKYDFSHVMFNISTDKNQVESLFDSTISALASLRKDAKFKPDAILVLERLQ